MSLYDAVASVPKGSRALSAARLRYEVLKILHRSLKRANLTQVQLAERLGVRKSAVNQVFKGDGNLRISTLAEYLHEMGVELAVEVVPVGTHRAKAVEEMDREWRSSRRVLQQIFPESSGAPTDLELERMEWHDSEEKILRVTDGRQS